MYEVKRRYRRFRVEHMNVSAKALFAEETELMNISMGGACIRADQSLRQTDKQLVRIKSEKTPLSLPCSFVWEDTADNAVPASGRIVCYRSGLSFARVPPDTLIRLKDFIRESGVPIERRASDDLKPSVLRFMLHSNRKAFVYFRKTFPVRKISLGGMLVEAHSDIAPGTVCPMKLAIPDGNPSIRLRGRITSLVRA